MGSYPNEHAQRGELEAFLRRRWAKVRTYGAAEIRSLMPEIRFATTERSVYAGISRLRKLEVDNGGKLPSPGPVVAELLGASTPRAARSPKAESEAKAPVKRAVRGSPSVPRAPALPSAPVSVPRAPFDAASLARQVAAELLETEAFRILRLSNRPVSAGGGDPQAKRKDLPEARLGELLRSATGMLVARPEIEAQFADRLRATQTASSAYVDWVGQLVHLLLEVVEKQTAEIEDLQRRVRVRSAAPVGA